MLDLDNDDVIVFENLSIRDVSKKLGINETCISKVLRGVRYSTNHKHFYYR